MTLRWYASKAASSKVPSARRVGHGPSDYERPVRVLLGLMAGEDQKHLLRKKLKLVI